MKKLIPPEQPYAPRRPISFFQPDNLKNKESIDLGSKIIDRFYVWSTDTQDEITKRHSEMSEKDFEEYEDWKDTDFENDDYESRNFSLQDLIDLVPPYLSLKDCIFDAEVESFFDRSGRDNSVIANVKLLFPKYKNKDEAEAANAAEIAAYEKAYAQYEKDYEHWKNVLMPEFNKISKEQEIQQLETKLKDLKNGE